MKRFLTLLTLALMFQVSANAATAVTHWSLVLGDAPELQAVSPDALQLGLEQFLTLTPKQYKEMTGEKLGVKKALQLKAAQKFVKKSMGGEPEIPKGLYILMAILGFAWIGMGLMDDWSDSDWIVNLILVALCWLPGFIHALVKMKKYY
jgi:uncharacterized membrane protein YqaE (UPF0057 family)